jgi:NAD+ kinase
MSGELRLALATSPTAGAQAAAEELKQRYEWVPIAEAEVIVALGGDGFLLQVLHQMLDRRRALPVFGMNLGTVGFLMNEFSADLLENRLARAKTVKVQPLRMDAAPTFRSPPSTKCPCFARPGRPLGSK